MRNYKNYDVSEYNLQEFLDVMSDLQCDIRAAMLPKEGTWRFLLFIDNSDEETLDRQIESFKGQSVNAYNE